MTSRAQPTRVTIQEFKPEEIPMSCTWIIVGPPGSGKCLGKGTELLMYDGSLKNVEDVVNGDILMGDDSTPRIVQGTTSGFGKLYRIEQTNGDSYIVNAPHILVLRKAVVPRKYVDNYGSWKVECYKDEKRNYMCCADEERADLILSKMIPNVNYDPYQTIEIEAEKYYKRVQIAQHFPSSSSVVSQDDILDYKGYKANVQFQKGKVTEDERLQFLAKLIDVSDADKSNEYYTIVTRNERLADKIKLVSDSLGFHTKLEGDILVEVKDVIKSKTENDTTSSTPEVTETIPSSSSSSGTSYVEVKSDEGEVLETKQELQYKITIRGNLQRIPIQNVRENLVSFTSDSDITITEIDDGEWFGFELDGNKRFVLRDMTVTHNTTFIENMMYILKDRYPVGTAFIGTEGAYERFCQIMHPLYVRPRYDEEEEKNHILRQKTCALENGGKHTANYAINVLDDVSDDPKIYKTNVMRGLFKLGAQHWHQLLMVGSQYAIDMPPDVRKSVSYVAIFMEPEDQERKKLYANFGGLAGSYENFCDLMDQITGDYTCLIFRKRTQTQSLEENVFWFKGRQLPLWKFGCREYRKWADERYDKDYVEEPQV
jgi:hypothetical protein